MGQKLEIGKKNSWSDYIHLNTTCHQWGIPPIDWFYGECLKNFNSFFHKPKG